jgi:hypothetical protein
LVTTIEKDVNSYVSTSFIGDDYNDDDFEAPHYKEFTYPTTGKDGKIVEHKAIRDDLKFIMQLELNQHLNLNPISKDGERGD